MRAALVTGMVLAAVMTAACGGAKEQPAGTAAEPIFKPIDPALVPPPLGTPGVIRYWGLLPCADCAGIRTELALVQNPQTGEPQTYQLTETYLGTKNGDAAPITSSGTWTSTRGLGADAGAVVFTLDGGGSADAARSFEQVSPQELRQLDRKGERIQSALNYTLTRVSDAPITLPPATPAAAAPPATLGGEPVAMVTDLASGWPLALKVGQPMLARLTADRGAGGKWTLRAGTDGGVMAQDGTPAYETSARGGTEVFRLKAVKPGSTSLTFDYTEGATKRSVTYAVTVS